MPKDLFSDHAKQYASFRPSYPNELISFIISKVVSCDTAWDCGTGNGQVAKAVSPYFKTVYATDISESQLENAFQASNISYKYASAENAPFNENSIDLITVGQAIHWFDRDLFFEECKRVGKPGSILACFGYSPLRINTRFDELLDDFYYQKIYSYWEAERKVVEDEYKSLQFPFEEIGTPQFSIQLDWSLQDIEGYINTWSAVQKFIKRNRVNPVDELIAQMKPLLSSRSHSVHFPVFLKVGRIK